MCIYYNISFLSLFVSPSAAPDSGVSKSPKSMIKDCLKGTQTWSPTETNLQKIGSLIAPKQRTENLESRNN